MHLPLFQSRRTNYSALQVSTEGMPSDCNEDEAKLPLTSQPSSHHTFRCIRTLVCVALLSTLNIFGIIFGLRKQNSYPRPPQPIFCNCGSSVAEAKALNCRYDTLSVSWLPAHCREDELRAEFDRAGPNGSWPYYADKNATISITVEEISLLADLPREEAVFYSSAGWHVAHCAFYWRKEFRMRAKGLMTESRYDKESHIEHCYKIFTSGDALHEVNVASPVWIGGDGVSSGHHHHEAEE